MFSIENSSKFKRNISHDIPCVPNLISVRNTSEQGISSVILVTQSPAVCIQWVITTDRHGVVARCLVFISIRFSRILSNFQSTDD